jgi:BMFP domain-containing protein YqiC
MFVPKSCEPAGPVTGKEDACALAVRLFSAHSVLGKVGRRQMAQTNNRFFDEVARLMNDAAGVASGVRREFDTVMRTQAERILRELDIVQREEFEAVKEMARLAREENEALKARIAALEARLGGRPGEPPGIFESSP